MSRRSARGFTLAEALVGLATLALAGVVALALFDGAQRAFRRGDRVAEMQQAARAALWRMGSEIGRAGLGVDPDGMAGRPDEPVEAAFPTAIVLRGDLDRDDPEAAGDPELALAGGAFANVATGNDEIVAYVLAKPDGSSRDVLEFDADVAEAPRDGRVERVRIERVALGQDDPPYTLYRITLHPDPARFGRAGWTVRTPLADNVRSMGFVYRDRAGAALADPVGGLDDAPGPARRAAIRRIDVELRVDLRHADPGRRPGDPGGRRAEAEGYALSASFTPRNPALPAPPAPGGEGGG